MGESGDTPSIEEDLFVEVGDSVTYCQVDTPAEKRVIRIIDGSSNPNMGVANEHTPLAQALLGLSIGEIGDLVVPGQKAREVRALKIERSWGVATI